jgi:hypothetical protein
VPLPRRAVRGRIHPVSPPLLVVDFDGTVCRGDAPVRYYAAVIADSMPPQDARDFLDAIERYLSGVPPRPRPAPTPSWSRRSWIPSPTCAGTPGSCW